MTAMLPTYRVDKILDEVVSLLIDIDAEHTLRVDVRGKVIGCSCDQLCVATRRSTAVIEQVRNDFRQKSMAKIRSQLDEVLHRQTVADLHRLGITYYGPLD